MGKSDRKQLDEILAYAAERGIVVPADILLEIGKQDTKALLDALKLNLNLNLEDIPVFSLREKGLVPASKKKDVILFGDGWRPMPNIRVPTGPMIGGGGGITDHALLANLTYATAGHTGFQAALAFPLAANLGGTGVANLVASTLTLGAATSITGGGTIGLGGFTLTVPATGTAALLATQNVFTVPQTITPAVDADGVFKVNIAGGLKYVINVKTSGVAPNVYIRSNLFLQDPTPTNYMQLFHSGAEGIIYTNLGSFSFQPADGLVYIYTSGVNGTFRVYGSTGGTKSIALTHSGTLGTLLTNTGHLRLSPVAGSNVGIAEANPTGLLQITGRADQIQLRVLANATQTANILEIETSGNVDLITVDPSGNLYLATTQMLQFRDAGVFINSATDGHLDLDADISIDANAPLVLVAGTATAGDAPLKFTSGALLATPEAGAMEFYDGRWYITGTAKQRVIDRTGGVIVATTTVANTAVETTIWTETLSANAMRAGRLYKLHCDGIISNHSNDDDITFNFYVGGTLLATVTPTLKTYSNATWSADFEMTVRTIGMGGTSALHGDVFIGALETLFASLQAVDTTAANAITLKVKWNTALAANTISIYQGWLELKN